MSIYIHIYLYICLLSRYPCECIQQLSKPDMCSGFEMFLVLKRGDCSAQNQSWFAKQAANGEIKEVAQNGVWACIQRSCAAAHSNLS